MLIDMHAHVIPDGLPAGEGWPRIESADGARALVSGQMRLTPAIPAKEGRPDVSAGNLVGTMLSFVLFNPGLIAAAAPVDIAPLTRALDWPFLVGSTWVATFFLWRGGVSPAHGFLLLVLYAAYVAAHVVLG